MDPELTAAEAMDLVVSSTTHLTGSGGSALQTVEAGEYKFHSANGLGAPLLGRRMRMNQQSLIGLALPEDATRSAGDARIAPRGANPLPVQAGIVSIAVTPIRHLHEVIGALALFSDLVDAFSEDQIRTLEMLGGLAGAAIARARARTALRESELRYRAVIESALDPI